MEKRWYYYFLNTQRAALLKTELLMKGHDRTAGAVLTPEQAIRSRSISGLTFSPDGAHLACVVSDPPKGAAAESHIWVFNTPRTQFRQFTFSSKSESSPLWSPDSHTLAFLSNRDERMQVFLIRSDGGEASPLTSGKNAVSAFRWSPGGNEIAFLAPEPKSEADEKKEEDKDDAKVADRPQDLARLWVVDVASKKTRQITRGDWRIEDFDWISADRILAVATNQPRAETWNTALFNISAVDGKVTPFAQPGQPFGGLTISPDRTQAAYVAAHKAGPMPYDLFLQNVAGGSPQDVTAGIDRPVLGVKWQNNSRAVFSVADGFYDRLYRLDGNSAPAPIDLPSSSGDFAIAPDGAMIYVALGFNRLPELFLQAGEACRKTGQPRAGRLGRNYACRCRAVSVQELR
jgi:Tol biopolymer transport system component